MAKRIGIFGADQMTGEPRTFVKKTVACLLVRRLLAYWEIENVSIRMLPANRIQPLRAVDVQPLLQKFYMPENLPPVELPDIHFEDPVQRERLPLLKQYEVEASLPQ